MKRDGLAPILPLLAVMRDQLAAGRDFSGQGDDAEGDLEFRPGRERRCPENTSAGHAAGRPRGAGEDGC